MSEFSNLNFEEAIFHICDKPEFRWSFPWWRLFEIIVQVPEDSWNKHRDAYGREQSAWATRHTHFEIPPDVCALGCRGVDMQEEIAWLFFDLDVQHGSKAYAARDEALCDATSCEPISTAMQKSDSRAAAKVFMLRTA